MQRSLFPRSMLCRIRRGENAVKLQCSAVQCSESQALIQQLETMQGPPCLPRVQAELLRSGELRQVIETMKQGSSVRLEDQWLSSF